MPVLGSSAYAVVGTITQDVRAMLNDSAGNVYTDPMLMPFFNRAYNLMWSALENNGDETLIGDEYFFVVPAISGNDPSAQVVVSDTAIVIQQAGGLTAFVNPAEAANPQNFLPLDLYRPVELWERIAGLNDNFTPMSNRTARGGLPTWGQGTTSLINWEWREDGLCFNGALSDVQVKMRYDKMFADAADSSASIAIRNGINFLTFKTAFWASRAKGSPRAAEFDADAAEALFQMELAVVRSDQKPRRRRPHSSGRRNGPWV